MAKRTTNPVVSKAKLRKRVHGLIEAAKIRQDNAKKWRGQRRQGAIRDAYAQAMTARYIAVEILDDERLEDEVHVVLDPISEMNPMPGVPGGGIAECIAEMSTRPDVDDPGALCAWIAQQRGEYGRRSLPHIKRGGKKTSKSLRSALRKATNPLAPTTESVISILTAHLTQYDQRMSSRRGYNPYALGHYMRAATAVEEAVPSGPLTEGSARALKKAIDRYFIVDSMPPAKKTIAAIDDYLVGKPLKYPVVKVAKKRSKNPSKNFSAIMREALK